MQGTIIFGLVFAIIIAIFAIQNASIVALNILTWEFEISLAVVVLGSIIFGALVIGIFSYVKQFQLRRKNKNLKLEIQSLKEKLEKEKEEKAKIKRYNVENVNVEDAEEKTEEKKEKRGFFGRKKKDKKEKTEEESEEESIEKKDKDIAYNLEEDNQIDKNKDSYENTDQ